ncbi:MAG TPA: TRAM domain-containing protein [Acidimicrobiales bacterium]|nr:TRAM domain-containing protein [Acidimicrobiales bacterium]HVB71040.1 TRAM domain-containing protein [Acidimicrobiales bacterium]
MVRVKRAATGGAVGRLDDGRVIFVRHALPGELVRVEVTEVSRSFARGDAVEVLEASPERVTAPCPYAKPRGCGGCDLQHASDIAQLEWKASIVAEHLRRIAKVERDVEVLGTGVAQGSRSRLRCAVTDQGLLALHESRSHDLVALDACWIADARLQRAFATQWSQAEEVELRAIGDGDAFAVVRHETPAGISIDLRSLQGASLDGRTRSEVSVAGHRFVVSPTAFWQSHRSAPSLLLETVIAFAGLESGDSVVDLFSGVGLFAVPLGAVVGPNGRVSAVESSPSTAHNARENARDAKNVTVREWSVTARAVNDTVGSRDVVVLDPPRQGLSRGVAPALVRRAPRRLVYVSCDAATFARDLKVFLHGGYNLRDLRVFDLFPMTEHVELVALLDIDPIRVESDDEDAPPSPRGR